MNYQNDLPYFLFLSRIKGIGAVKFNQILNKNKRLGITIKEFFSFFKSDLEKKYLFIKDSSKQIISNYLSYLDEEKYLIKKLNEKSIQPITILETSYPKRLKDTLELSAPPILYVKGNLNLLSNPLVAIVGTRKPSNIGLEITRTLSSRFTSHNYTIVSGYANGIDLLAHNSALDSNGNTILVLGCGLFHYSETKINKSKTSHDNTLVVSEFYPTFPWHRGYLMTRNKTICGLVDGVFVVESKETGGSFHTGTYALILKKPTFTFSYPEKNNYNLGNNKLIDQGAKIIPAETPAELAMSIDEIVQKLNYKEYKKDQYSLFDELGERIKKYVKLRKPFPVVLLNEL